MSRHYSRADRLIRALDTAIRTTTGANGLPPREPTAEQANAARPLQRELRVVHKSLAATQGISAGQRATARPGHTPASQTRQNDSRIEGGTRALNQTTDAMSTHGVTPSASLPLLYAGGFMLGAITNLLGSEQASRSLVLDTQRRRQQTLDESRQNLTQAAAAQETDNPQAHQRCADHIESMTQTLKEHSPLYNDMGGLGTTNSRVARPVGRLLDLAGKIIEGR